MIVTSERQASCPRLVPTDHLLLDNRLVRGYVPDVCSTLRPSLHLLRYM